MLPDFHCQPINFYVVYCIQYTGFCFNWRDNMNQNTVAIGVFGVVVTAALAFNQAQPPEQAQVNSSGKGVIESTVLSHVNSNAAKVVASLGGPSEPQKEQPTEEQSTKMMTVVKSQHNSHNLTSTHEQPADHYSASQPKHHGHEHVKPRRRLEDNSLMPPGEPKKPLPELSEKN